ncbi:hypothetical protein [Streptosporangium canum]|uniref:hypothetical protein n=1 Tax=Streptosporangium canum TaxID=324952 RepID=UPI0037B8872B
MPVTARLVRAGEDTVRDVIHRFDAIGPPACLDPRPPSRRACRARPGTRPVRSGKGLRWGGRSLAPAV